MKKILKGLSFVFLLVILCLTTACSGAPGSKKDYTLSDFDGWWQRPDDYVSEGISMVDIFKIDSEAETWTSYNEYGFPGSEFGCYVEENLLILELDALGDAVFQYNGEALVDEDTGDVEFVRCDPIEEFDTSYLEGKWYKYGSTDEDYYLIEGDTYELCSPHYPDEPLATGTWTINDVTHFIDDDTSTIQTEIEFQLPEDSYTNGDFILTEDGNAFFDDFHGSYYVKESVLDTSEGDDTVAVLELISNDWNGPESGDPYLEFYYYGKFDIVEYNSDGFGERSQAGSWSFQDMELTLEFEDGTTETLDFSSTEITVEHYDMTFERNGGWW